MPLLDVVSGAGIGWPDGYPGTEPAPRPAQSPRDSVLLALAQAAALDGCGEVLVDEGLPARLATASTDRLRPPPHLELAVRVSAPDLKALACGRYRVTVTSVSRAGGVVTGRFLPVLGPEDRDRVSAELGGLPAGEPGVLRAQLSFPPLHPSSAHVTRTPQVLPHLLSVSECRDTTAPDVLTSADLAVGCDSHRLYLAAPHAGARVEAWALHALNLHTHTPPLARLITELSRAQYTQVTDFDWGAASDLSFLPRLRAGRIVLSPARWRLPAADLPSAPSGWVDWQERLAHWRARRRVPGRVLLAVGDWRLPVNLDHDGDQVLLRDHLRTHPHADLVEDTSDDGWCHGRAHEVVVGVAATAPAGWPRLPRPARHRMLHHDEAHLPGASPILMAHLYADRVHHDALLELPPVLWRALIMV